MGTIRSAAPSASIRPRPTAVGPPCVGTGWPVAVKALNAVARDSAPGSLRSHISAAAAAACGAAAEVPKNRHVPPTLEPKNVFAPPSVAAMCGTATTSGAPSGAAGVVPSAGPKYSVRGPRELNVSGSCGCRTGLRRR